MTEERIEQKAKEYADIFGWYTVGYYGVKDAFIAGAHSRSPQEMFDELNPYQKADFMKNNVSWARTCDLRDELKLRHEL